MPYDFFVCKFLFSFFMYIRIFQENEIKSTNHFNFSDVYYFTLFNTF